MNGLLQLHTPAQAADWLRTQVIGTVWADSRQVRPGDGFIAWPGAASDGRRFVGTALDGGAAACLVESAGVETFGLHGHKVATYAGLKTATGPIAAAYFGEPSQHLQIVAVTGTNGKTTTAWWLAQALTRLGSQCGLVGTLGIGTPGAMVTNGLTTPDPVLLQQQLRRMVDAGCSACALEASSIGLEEERLLGTQIGVAVLTNFTQDHLDYHGSMQSYWQAKRKLFDWPGLRAAVVNLDDAKGRALQAGLAGTALELWTCSCDGAARIRAATIQQDAHGLHVDVVEDGIKHAIRLPTVGRYNVANLLGVLASLRALGFPMVDAVRACTNLPPVPGRTETLATPGQPLAVIDYAHTPDALEKVLLALQPVTASRGGRLWCVFGCGGDRDIGKRPLMAAIAEKNADRLVITSDNPRTEEPLAIIEQMRRGLSKPELARVQPDRQMAIADALALAEPQDVVLVAGKGHEDYQDIRGVKHPFSDGEYARLALKARAPVRQEAAA